MPSISVSRDSGYVDRIRAYRVVVDGREVGRLRNGETKTFSVESGTHELRIKIDWCCSHTIRFTLAANQTSAFECGSALRGAKVLLVLFYPLFAWNKYVWLRPVSRGNR